MAPDRVRSALLALPAGERIAIELAYLGGLTYKEVAEHLQIPEGTAKSHIRGGLRRLNLATRGDAPRLARD
jgi:RNA polymerase sigma-70 factor (ECF subfamily)